MSLNAKKGWQWYTSSALPLDKLEPFLAQVKAVDDLVKSFPPVIID